MVEFFKELNKKRKKKKLSKKQTCGAIIVAAGKSTRMNSAMNKQFLMVRDRPVLAYTLEAFEACPDIHEIVVVTQEDAFLLISDIAKEYGITKLKNIVKGGETRQDSVLYGVLEYDERCDFLAVHDGARPFVLPGIISQAVDAAKQHKAAAVGVFMRDTIKQVGADGFIEKTLDRSKLVAIQTPQVFEAQLLRRALLHAKQQQAQVTDDCMAVEALGVKVKLVQGNYDNIKITTDEDLSVCEAIIARREDELDD